MPKRYLFALLPLAGCVAPPADTLPIGPVPGTCDDRALASFVGQPAGDESSRKLMEASGARILRWVPYGGAVTMDYSPQRLTVQLDRDNRIASAQCG